MTDDYDGAVPPTPTDAVRPLDEHGAPVVAEAPAKKKRSPRVVFAGAAAAVLVVGGLGGWLWWTNVIRGPLGAAEVIPGSADVVLTIDALQLIEENRFERLIEAFNPVGVDLDIQDLIEAADDEIESETGIRVLADAGEWIGQSAALAIWFPDDLFADFNPDIEFALSIMARDEGRAQEFLDDIVTAALDSGDEVETIEILGVDIYSVSDEDVPVLVTVHSGRMLLASDPDRMIDMLEPQDTITDRSAYQRLWNAVDGDDAFFSMYVSERFLEDFFVEALEQSGTDVSSIPVGATLGTATIDDDGVEFSLASIAVDDTGQSVAGTWGQQLPAGTYGYMSVALPFEKEDIEDLFDDQVDSLADLGLGLDVGETLGFFEDAFGVSVRDVVSQFSDEMLFAVIAAEAGPLPAVAGGPLGVGLAVGVDDEDVILQALENLPGVFGPAGEGIVPLDGGLWEFDIEEGPFFTYGVVGHRLVIASDRDTLAAVTEGDGGVSDDAEWQRLSDFVGEDMLVYVNIAGILDAFADRDLRRDLKALRSFGATASASDGISIVTMRLVIDY